MLNEFKIIPQAQAMLASLLHTIPFVAAIKMDQEQEILLNGERRADFIVTLCAGNDEVRLVCGVKHNLQPRHVFDVIRQVRETCLSLSGGAVYPVVVSEYISARSAEIFIEQNVSYFDLAGNCRLCFANVYIEKKGDKPKNVESRGVKSLFGLKSSRMLRLMLENRMRPWQVKELVAKTNLSLGQVSNIRRALLDQQFVIESPSGIQLTQPAVLLHDWARIYKKNIITIESGYYSLLNSEERLGAIKQAIAESTNQGGRIMLNGLSAARWQAPYTKPMSETFYADEEGVEILKKHLLLEPVKHGPNVIIEQPKDLFVFEEAVDCAPGLKCASAIQTYLDLYIAGEREREAAEHIESQLLKEKWGG